jgi:predicted alpha/beta superfamily hydrolase
MAIILAPPVFARAQGRVTFKLVAPAGQPTGTDSFFLASDKNRWAPNDVGWMFIRNRGELELSRNFQRPDTLEFKVTRGSWDRAESDADGFPASNRRLVVRRDTLLLLTVAGWTDKMTRKHTASPRVILATDSFASRYLGNHRKIWAWLPPSYGRTPAKRYPVIYLQDGQNLFDRATTAFGTEWRVDEAMDSLSSAGYPECIVIGIESGANRTVEYMPYPSARFPDAHGEDYAKFVTEELVPWVDRKYRTMPDAGNRVIAGSSLGGLISLYVACSRPGLFGGVGAFSSAYWVAPGIFTLAEQNKMRLSGMFYLYAGDSEAPGLVDETGKMAGILRQNPLLRVKEQYQKGGKHQEADWQGPFRDFMVFLLGK